MSIWQFVSDPANQQTLAFYGGGAAIVISALWTAWLTLRKKPTTPKPPPSQQATGRDGITATGNVQVNGGVHITNTQVPKPLIAVALAGCVLIAVGFFLAGDTNCTAGSVTGGDINAGDITINADGARAEC